MTQEKLPHRKELCLQSEGSTGILRWNLFMLVFTQLILKNVLDQTVVKITVTETVHPG